MNIKRFLLATFAVFGFIFLYEFIVHGFLLRPTYEETPNVWRTTSEIQANMPLAIILQLALAVWITYIFSKFFPLGGISEGVRFGLYFGIFAGILSASWYIWLPVAAKVGWSWFVSSAIEGICSGLILGSIYKRFQ